MKLWGLYVGASLAIGWSALACAPAAAPSATLVTGKSAEPAGQIKPSEPKPAQKAEAKADWRAEWEQVLQAARREGRVAIAGPAGSDVGEILTSAFEQQYGISVELFGATGAQQVTRISTERAAGRYEWDIHIGGSTNFLDTFIPNGYLEPLEPAMILPEVKEPQTWRGGAVEFLDDGHRVMVMILTQRTLLAVNSTMVRTEELRSYKDLLDPRWKGQMVADDPRVAGPGEASFTVFFLHPDLGPEFIRALAQQEITLLKDRGQQVDAIGQGRYSVLVGVNDNLAEQRMRQGVPIELVDPRQLREGADVRGGGEGQLALFNRAPHPNAAKVYINWLLSKEAQTALARAVGGISQRVDVPTDHALPWRVPQPGAMKTYSPQATKARKPLRPLLIEVFGSA